MTRPQNGAGRLGGRSTAVLVALPAAALCLIGGLAGCGKDASTDGGPGRKIYPGANVVLVTLDTVRPDRLSCYGYERNTTPNLDAFAKGAVRFENAYGQSSFTPPSHASILTSRYPSSHGVLWWNKRLAEAVSTVGEVFQARGYETASFSPLKMGTGNGLDKGFDRVVEIGDDERYHTPVKNADPYRVASGTVINERFSEWLGQRQDKPFFTWVHFYDAHRPYSIFSPERAFCEIKDGALGDHTSLDYQLDPKERAERKLGPPHARYLKDRYDSGLLGLDREIGKLLKSLEGAGVLDDSIVVFIADHGEAFDEFEEEWFTHDPFLFDVVTHVPLLIRFPDGRYAGDVVDGLVEAIDVSPTLLDFIGTRKADGMQGTSLRPLLDGKEGRPFVFSETQGKDIGPDKNPIDPNHQRTIRNRRSRLIANVRDDSFRMFDREAEANEHTDRFDAEVKSIEAAVSGYRSFVATISRLTPTLNIKDLSAEDLEWMKQNGYLGD